MAALVRQFTQKGMVVGTLKHPSHGHELDKPGKDSHVHRTAGANPAAMVTSKMAALYFPASDQTRPEILIEKYYSHADIVLIEGWISGPYPKIEIWRESIGKPPLFSTLTTVSALVCDQMPGATKRQNPDTFDVNDISGISQHILDLHG